VKTLFSSQGLMVTAVCLVVILVGSAFILGRDSRQSVSSVVDPLSLTQQLSRHIVLPAELPEVIKIDDPRAYMNENATFFGEAKVGEVWFKYPEMDILFDPERDKITKIALSSRSRPPLKIALRYNENEKNRVDEFATQLSSVSSLYSIVESAPEKTRYDGDYVIVNNQNRLEEIKILGAVLQSPVLPTKPPMVASTSADVILTFGTPQ